MKKLPIIACAACVTASVISVLPSFSFFLLFPLPALTKHRACECYYGFFQLSFHSKSGCELRTMYFSQVFQSNLHTLLPSLLCCSLFLDRLCKGVVLIIFCVFISRRRCRPLRFTMPGFNYGNQNYMCVPGPCVCTTLLSGLTHFLFD